MTKNRSSSGAYTQYVSSAERFFVKKRPKSTVSERGLTYYRYIFLQVIKYEGGYQQKADQEQGLQTDHHAQKQEKQDS